MEQTDEQMAEYKRWCDTEVAAGRCPDSGLALHACHLGPCDCFDTCRLCS